MPTTMQATRIQPKRKRADVVYYKSDSEDSDTEVSGKLSDEVSNLTKKVKTNKGKAVSTKPLPKKKIFPFTKLPSELKNQIYELALRDQNEIFLISKTKAYRRTVQRTIPHGSDGTRRNRSRYGYWYIPPKQQDAVDQPESPTPAALVPNILLLNREIYAETQPILYGGNAFAVEDTTALFAFLACIGSKNCATLTNITIKGWGYTKAHKSMNHPAFTMLGSAVNLESLYIDCRIHWDGPKGVARQIFRDGHHYLEAVGNAKGRYDAAVDVLDFEHKNWDYARSGRCRQHPTAEGPTAAECLEEFRAELRNFLRPH